MSKIITCLTMIVGIVTAAPLSANTIDTGGVVVNGVRYDRAGKVTAVSPTSITVDAISYLTATVDGARSGKKAVPTSYFRPGMYVGLMVGQTPGGELTATSITELPQ